MQLKREIEGLKSIGPQMNILKYSVYTLLGGISLSLAPGFACDITDLPCWDGGKCNIQFKNRTGNASGDASGTTINQSSAAQTIKVKAVKSNGDKAGNKLSIDVNASKTMNMEKKYKKNFSTIKVSTTNGVTLGFALNCKAVKNILRGNGTCKVFHGTTAESSNTYVLGYSCDGGSVDGPSF